jgi:hypothetical protein
MTRKLIRKRVEIEKRGCGGKIINLKPLKPFFEVLEIIANRLDFGLFHTRDTTAFWLIRHRFPCFPLDCPAVKGIIKIAFEPW